MRPLFLALGVAALAGPVAAQSIDSAEEAWAIARRNSVTPEGWRLMNVDASTAAFLSLTGGADTGRWVATLDADAMQIEFGLVQADCRAGVWRWRQSSTRDWSGNFVSDGGATDYVAPVPGSVGEAIFAAICPSYRPTLPVPPLPTPGGA